MNPLLTIYSPQAAKHPTIMILDIRGRLWGIGLTRNQN